MSAADSPIPVAVLRVGGRGEPLELPRYQTPGAAGMDLRADEPVDLRVLRLDPRDDVADGLIDERQPHFLGSRHVDRIGQDSR